MKNNGMSNNYITYKKNCFVINEKFCMNDY